MEENRGYRRRQGNPPATRNIVNREELMTIFTRRQFLGTAGAAGATIALGQSQTALAQAKRITIGTNPQGSIFFTLGSGLAKVFTEKMDVQAIVQPVGGSSVNLPLVNSGELTGSLASTIDSGQAYRGEREYEGRSTKNLRSVARIFNLPYVFLVRADSGIKTIADLKGKRVVMTFKQLLGLQPMNEAMIQAGGLQLSDITPVTVAGLKQGLDAVADGSADASSVAAGIAMVQEMHASTPVSYLSVTGPNATSEFMAKTLAGTELMTLAPNPRMPEVTAPVTIGTYDVFLLAGANVSEGDVNKMTTVLVENWADLQKDYPPLRGSKIEDLSKASNVVPYHPGAVAAYKAKNMWSARNDAAEKAIM
jgi:TRAP transporter TAXI family solute receptor